MSRSSPKPATNTLPQKSDGEPSSGAGGSALTQLRAAGLTAREAEVLQWIAEGKTSREVGTILCCAPKTVDKHAERILKKLGVENRQAAAAEMHRWMLAK